MLGQNREYEALEDMVVLPEWAACRWSRASGLRERGTRGLSPQRNNEEAVAIGMVGVEVLWPVSKELRETRPDQGEEFLVGGALQRRLLQPGPGDHSDGCLGGQVSCMAIVAVWAIMASVSSISTHSSPEGVTLGAAAMPWYVSPVSCMMAETVAGAETQEGGARLLEYPGPMLVTSSMSTLLCLG